MKAKVLPNGQGKDFGLRDTHRQEHICPNAALDDCVTLEPFDGVRFVLSLLSRCAENLAVRRYIEEGLPNEAEGFYPQ